MFVATSTLGFWVVEGMEFANAFTYGGNYLSSFPFTVFGTAIRRFFTFVVPAPSSPTCRRWRCSAATTRPACRAGSPGASLPVSLLAAAAALLIWRNGLRRYVGAGS